MMESSVIELSGTRDCPKDEITRLSKNVADLTKQMQLQENPT